MRRAALLLLSSLLSGAMFAAALPPADVQLLGWICFVPLLLALKGQRLIWAVLAPLGSLLFGAWLTTTGWLYPGIPRLEGDDAWHYAGFMLYALALAPAFVAASVQQKVGPVRLLVLASAFVAAESLLLLYLPAHLALTQHRSPAMLWLASWVGIWGVSFVLWFVQIWLARRATEWVKEWPGTATRHRALGVGIGLAVFVAALWIFPSPEAFRGGTGRGTVVGAVQTLEPGAERLLGWNVEARLAGAKLVVWPELSAIGMAAGGKTGPLLEYSRLAFQPAFVTTFPDDAKPKPHNTASVFFAGRETGRYFKRKPFAAEAQEHQAGSGAASGDAGGMGVGLAVCFDSCFPTIMREAAMVDGVQVVALPCMGPESPYGVIQAVHGAFTPFRSAELGVPIVRAESSAFAMITDKFGRIVAVAPAGLEGVILAEVDSQPRWTLIRVLGDWVLYGCWAAVAFAVGKWLVGRGWRGIAG